MRGVRHYFYGNEMLKKFCLQFLYRKLNITMNPFKETFKKLFPINQNLGLNLGFISESGTFAALEKVDSMSIYDVLWFAAPKSKVFLHQLMKFIVLIVLIFFLNRNLLEKKGLR
jgi:hypothetical protein